MLNIRRETAASPMEKPDSSALGFGKYFSDHMFLMDYIKGEGWTDPRIVPYGELRLPPSAMVFHYAQEVFEGLKAYRADDGRVLLFRPEENARRMNVSCVRMCIPEIPEEDWVQAVSELVGRDRDWVPQAPGTSLYIRPFVIATDPFVGVRASNTYTFIVITSPVGAYYPTGLDPVSIYVERTYVRAVKGGTGFTKCGGNYAASIKAQNEAHEQGFTQVLWLDGVERRYIEEVGTMNVFFQLGDTVVTPMLEGSVLPGITRKSVIELLKRDGIKVEERRIAIEEVEDAAARGTLGEVFGTGTAAVISPVGRLRVGENTIELCGGKIGALSQRLYDALTGIQWGRLPDAMEWTRVV